MLLFCYCCFFFLLLLLCYIMLCSVVQCISNIIFTYVVILLEPLHGYMIVSRFVLCRCSIVHCCWADRCDECGAWTTILPSGRAYRTSQIFKDQSIQIVSWWSTQTVAVKFVCTCRHVCVCNFACMRCKPKVVSRLYHCALVCLFDRPM